MLIEPAISFTLEQSTLRKVTAPSFQLKKKSCEACNALPIRRHDAARGAVDEVVGLGWTGFKEILGEICLSLQVLKYENIGCTIEYL